MSNDNEVDTTRPWHPDDQVRLWSISARSSSQESSEHQARQVQGSSDDFAQEVPRRNPNEQRASMKRQDKERGEAKKGMLKPATAVSIFSSGAADESAKEKDDLPKEIPLENPNEQRAAALKKSPGYSDETEGKLEEDTAAMSALLASGDKDAHIRSRTTGEEMEEETELQVATNLVALENSAVAVISASLQGVAPPGAEFIRGPGYQEDSSSPLEHTKYVIQKNNDGEKGQQEAMASAPLVRKEALDEEAGAAQVFSPLVVATKLSFMSLLKDRRVHALIPLFVLLAIALITWAFTSH